MQTASGTSRFSYPGVKNEKGHSWMNGFHSAAPSSQQRETGATSHRISCILSSSHQRCFLLAVSQKVEISKCWCMHLHQTAEGRDYLHNWIYLPSPSLLIFRKLDSRPESVVNIFVQGHKTLPLVELCCLVIWGCIAEQFSMTANEMFHPPLWGYDMWGTLEIRLNVQLGDLVLWVVQGHWNDLVLNAAESHWNGLVLLVVQSHWNGLVLCMVKCHWNG